MKKIGVLGGSFDPIHVGHVSVARQVAKALSLAKVLIVPAGRPPHKDASRLAPGRDRLEMCRLAVHELTELEISALEIRKTTTSYTLDTLKELRGSLPPQTETYFIIGADTLPELPSWYCIEDLIRLTRWAIVPRPGMPEVNFQALETLLSAEAIGRLREGVVRIEEPVDASATEIRRRLAAGEPVGEMLHAPVEAYIRRQGLYGAGR